MTSPPNIIYPYIPHLSSTTLQAQTTFKSDGHSAVLHHLITLKPGPTISLCPLFSFTTTYICH